MRSHPPIVIALTGGIACGKSEAGRILEREGFSVLDTDAFAHELMRRDTPLFRAVLRHFGACVVGANGELDRTVLGTIVFNDSVALSELNALVHPALIAAAEQWRARQTGDAAILVPLLFETGWTAGWDSIICVSAEEATAIDRLRARGLTPREARLRIASQMALSEKEKRSDFTIKNSGSLEALSEEVLRILECIRNQRNSDE